MFGLEKYKNLLGTPGEGFHSHGTFGFAVLDLIAALFVSFLISRFFGVNFFIVGLVLLATGVAMHRAFGVNTKLNNLLFGSY